MLKVKMTWQANSLETQFCTPKYAKIVVLKKLK